MSSVPQRGQVPEFRLSAMRQRLEKLKLCWWQEGQLCMKSICLVHKKERWGALVACARAGAAK